MEFSCQSIKGIPIIIYNKSAGGTYPIHGAWWNGEEWIPSAWKRNGKKFDWEGETDLDLDESCFQEE
jgi:hypothetical protein